jgi:hypothetical protein
MSAENVRLVSIALLLLGGVLIGVCAALALALWWCVTTDDPQHAPLAAKVCASGNFKDIALALVGSVSALAGAYALRRKTP